jgi:hypothetical protein
MSPLQSAFAGEPPLWPVRAVFAPEKFALKQKQRKKRQFKGCLFLCLL